MNDWPSMPAVVAQVEMPGGYSAEQLSDGDIPEVVQRLRAWYPDVRVGEESVHLDEGFYRSQVQLAGEQGPARDVFAVILRRGSELVAIASLQRNRPARTVSGRLCVVSPDHRHAGLGWVGVRLLESVGRGVGAELLLSYVTLRHSISQRVMEACGWSPVGIVPGYDRDQIEPGRVLRVYEALYAKCLVTSEKLLPPDREQMSPRVRALYDHLFGPRQ
jgi:RimJ/RimL family protein N-acetyltransferase